MQEMGSLFPLPCEQVGPMPDLFCFASSCLSCPSLLFFAHLVKNRGRVTNSDTILVIPMLMKNRKS